MRCRDEELRSLGALINSGQIEQLGKHMLAMWPPNAEWDREDVDFLTTLLRGNKNLFGEKAIPIYRAYAERLKSHTDNMVWLRTLPNRSEIVEMYEGMDAAIAWMEALRPQIMAPNDGIVDLIVGRILRAKGSLIDARRHLLSAVEHSMQGVEWYCLEALNEMGMCLAQLGESCLAFEYARTHSFESFKLGRIKEQELYRAVCGLAMVFGQIDYRIEVKRNLARNACEEEDFNRASEEESDASLRLAMISNRDEAVIGMYRAAEYAARGSHPNDPYFAVACVLLARYLDENPLSDDEMGSLWDKAAQIINIPFMDMPVFRAMQQKVEECIVPDATLLHRWLSLCNRYQHALSLSADKSQSLLICNHLTALMGRYYAERHNEMLAVSFIEEVASIESGEAIFVFTRQDYVNQLILDGKLQEALKVCQLVLAQDLPIIDERFAFAQLAARCCLSLKFDQQAFAYAKLALSDWKRILEGLFVEEHKAAWLERGVSVISCAMEILAKPLSWMPEEDRYREIFNLIEQGKARMMTDMVSRSDYISGVYLLSEIKKKRTDLFEVLLQEYPDWFVPALIQTSADSNILTTAYHDDNGRIEKISKVNISALQSVIHLPLSPEKRLYATAQSLSFEKQIEPPSSELYNDLIQMITPRGEEI